MTKKVKVTTVRKAGDDHQVVSVSGGRSLHRKTPCETCPWKTCSKEFPAEAFKHSANTAYDMSDRVFGCHESGIGKPAVCAGFLLNGAAHNLTIRLKHMRGEIKHDVTDGGHELHKSYKEMAIANGVDPKDPVLKKCR